MLYCDLHQAEKMGTTYHIVMFLDGYHVSHCDVLNRHLEHFLFEVSEVGSILGIGGLTAISLGQPTAHRPGVLI